MWVAPLIAPAVGLSVLGVLLATRHLALHGSPVEVLRPLRRFTLFVTAITLALNIPDPLLVGDYGKAAFDAAGRVLLIGWDEVGPGMLQVVSQTGGPQQTELGAESGLQDQKAVLHSEGDLADLDRAR